MYNKYIKNKENRKIIHLLFDKKYRKDGGGYG